MLKIVALIVVSADDRNLITLIITQYPVPSYYIHGNAIVEMITTHLMEITLRQLTTYLILTSFLLVIRSVFTFSYEPCTSTINIGFIRTFVVRIWFSIDKLKGGPA